VNGPETRSWLSWWQGWWGIALLWGLTLTMFTAAIVIPSPRPGERRTAERLEKGAKAYCEMADADRAAIERQLFYRLPPGDGVAVTIECMR
jgi:hypothetical protein